MNPPPQIQRLLDDRSLEPLTPDAVAIEGLWIKAIHSDLDAREAMVSTDNRVGLAYQSGLQAVHALLQAYGYRVRSRTSHHHYTFYAAQALARASGNDAIDREALDLDRHRARRAAAVYEAEPATAADLTELLGILDRLLPAIRPVLIALLPDHAAAFLPPGTRAT
jgi:hypothetical protein